MTSTRVPDSCGTWRRRDVAVTDDVSIAWYEAGSADAPPIVLLHGIGHWARAAWDPLMPELADRYRVIAIDLPGFGDSSKPDARYDLAFFTSVLRELLASELPGRFALAGNSLGGMIAADYAGAYPERVAALGLIAPAGFLPTLGLVVRAFALAPLVERIALPAPGWMIRRTLDRAVYDPSQLSHDVRERTYALAQDPLVRRAFGRVYGSARTALWTAPALQRRFARYTGPTLLCWGRHDHYLPIGGLERARRTYPNATVIVIERCGHLPQVEEPATVAGGLRAIYPSTNPTRESKPGG